MIDIKNIKMLNGYVLFKKVTIKGGVIMPSMSQVEKKVEFGEVVASNCFVEEDAKYDPNAVAFQASDIVEKIKVGDIIMYSPYIAEPVSINGESHLVMTHEAVMAIVKMKEGK